MKHLIATGALAAGLLVLPVGQADAQYYYGSYYYPYSYSYSYSPYYSYPSYSYPGYSLSFSYSDRDWDRNRWNRHDRWDRHDRHDRWDRGPSRGWSGHRRTY